MALSSRIPLVLVFHLAVFGNALADGARYRLELHITWSAQTHPHEWPEEGGHLSNQTIYHFLS